nr:hypothetical protein [Enterococcus durans]
MRKTTVIYMSISTKTGNELAKEFMYWLLKLFFKSLAEMSLSITKTETGITIDYLT